MKILIISLSIVMVGCSFNPPAANQPADSPRYPVNVSEPLVKRL